MLDLVFLYFLVCRFAIMMFYSDHNILLICYSLSVILIIVQLGM